MKGTISKWFKFGSSGRNPGTKALADLQGLEGGEIGRGGDFYTSSGFNDLINRMGSDIRIDMTTLQGKRKALLMCTPFSTVTGRCGSMLSAGNYYVVDPDNNEHGSPRDKQGKRDSLYDKFEAVRKILKRPNPLQSGKQFAKQMEITLKTFGFCPVYMFRVLDTELPLSMWIIPPELFNADLTGQMWMQSELSGIIKRAYIEWGGNQIPLNDGEYFIVSDANAVIVPCGDILRYRSEIDSLTEPVSNWMAQIKARGTLIVDGGPKGVLCDDSGGDIYGNSSLSANEQESLNLKFKRKYGIVNKLYSILVTTAKVKWIPISSNTKDLMLHEEDGRCRETISNAIGINPNIFLPNAKYDNMLSGDKAAYQNIIIPDADNFAEALTRALGQEGITVKLDYAHVPALQENRAESARAFSLASLAIRNLYNDKLLTDRESRRELSNYIDINPDDPEGEFKQDQETVNNNLNNDGDDSVKDKKT